jgi:hypothetical protein
MLVVVANVVAVMHDHNASLASVCTPVFGAVRPDEATFDRQQPEKSEQY